MIGWILRKALGIPDAPTRASAETPGHQTSEGKMALWNTVVAALLAVLAMFWPDLPREEIRITVLWIAGILGGMSSGSYVLARTLLKRELARAQKEGSDPLADLVGVFKEGFPQLKTDPVASSKPSP